MRIRKFYLYAWLGMANLPALLGAPRCSAAEPQASFFLKSGWVECAVRRDGKPVADAIIQVHDEKGSHFAEGETGKEGQTAFPLPRGSSFTVEIKIAGQTADPIRLYQIDKGVAPGRVLLSYGLRPCCRSKLERDRPTAPRISKGDLAEEASAELQRRKFRPVTGPLQALLADRTFEAIPTQAHTLLLQPAPDFTLRDVDGKEYALARELKVGPVAVVFYFGYHCNHCVSQLFALDKDIEKFRELGVKVVAVSADPVETTRERFKQYGAFKFPVLSDPGNKLAEKYEVFTPNPKAGMDGDLMHGTFIISRQGKILWTNRGETPFTENRTLLHEFARAEGRLPAK